VEKSLKLPITQEMKGGKNCEKNIRNVKNSGSGKVDKY
jgi:hypothetical protein